MSAILSEAQAIQHGLAAEDMADSSLLDELQDLDHDMTSTAQILGELRAGAQPSHGSPGRAHWADRRGPADSSPSRCSTDLKAADVAADLSYALKTMFASTGKLHAAVRSQRRRARAAEVGSEGASSATSVVSEHWQAPDWLSDAPGAHDLFSLGRTTDVQAVHERIADTLDGVLGQLQRQLARQEALHPEPSETLSDKSVDGACMSSHSGPRLTRPGYGDLGDSDESVHFGGQHDGPHAGHPLAADLPGLNAVLSASHLMERAACESEGDEADETASVGARRTRAALSTRRAGRWQDTSAAVFGGDSDSTDTAAPDIEAELKDMGIRTSVDMQPPAWLQAAAARAQHAAAHVGPRAGMPSASTVPTQWAALTAWAHSHPDRILAAVQPVSPDADSKVADDAAPRYAEPIPAASELAAGYTSAAQAPPAPGAYSTFVPLEVASEPRAALDGAADEPDVEAGSMPAVTGPYHPLPARATGAVYVPSPSSAAARDVDAVVAAGMPHASAQLLRALQAGHMMATHEQPQRQQQQQSLPTATAAQASAPLPAAAAANCHGYLPAPSAAYHSTQQTSPSYLDHGLAAASLQFYEQTPAATAVPGQGWPTPALPAAAAHAWHPSLPASAAASVGPGQPASLHMSALHAGHVPNPYQSYSISADSIARSAAAPELAGASLPASSWPHSTHQQVLAKSAQARQALAQRLAGMGVRVR